MATTATVKILDLSPIPYDVCVTRRDSKTFGWILEDDNGPIDFTGDAFVLTVNSQADGGGSSIFNTPNSNTLDATGLIEFLPTIVNHTQVPAEYFYDVQWTDAGGDVFTVLKGSYTIGPDISV